MSKEILQVVHFSSVRIKCIFFFQVLLMIFALLIGNAEGVKELYDKIIESVVVKRTMAPNAWLWSLLENSKNREDIKLLFDVLEKLRRFVSFQLLSFGCL